MGQVVSFGNFVLKILHKEPEKDLEGVPSKLFNSVRLWLR